MAARKYSIETGMNTPLPTASIAIAVTNRRWRPDGREAESVQHPLDCRPQAQLRASDAVVAARALH